MKKLILLAVPLALLWGAHSVHAATAAPVEIGPGQAQELQLALNATSLVLDQVELKIDANASMPNVASVNSDLSAMKGTLTGIHATLAGTPGAAAQHVAVKPTGQSLAQGSVAGESVTQPQHASNDIAQAPAAESQDEEADEYASSSRLASISSTLTSKKFLAVALPIVIILVIVVFLLFRRRRKGTAPAQTSSGSSVPATTASSQTPAP